MNGQLIFEFLKDNQKIADFGSGISGAQWWKSIKVGSTVDAFDLYNKTKNRIPHVEFFQMDVTNLKGKSKYKEMYDLIIADHIFEHISNTTALLESIIWVSKKGAFVHVGVPDATNFTDIFYRLIHRFDSGGHVAKFDHNSIIKIMENAGFELVASEKWEDDWVWLEKCFSLKYNQVENVTQEEIQYLVNVFRKELTSEKGYFYGDEFVFRKK